MEKKRGLTSLTAEQQDDTRSLSSALREEPIRLQIRAVNKKYAGYNCHVLSDLYFSSQAAVLHLRRFKDAITVGEVWAIKDTVTALGPINSHILSHRTLCPPA